MGEIYHNFITSTECVIEPLERLLTGRLRLR
jgi:hypothetical protein